MPTLPISSKWKINTHVYDEIGDADGYNLPVPILLNNLKKYTSGDTVVILMHDAGAKTTTVQALPQIIQYLISKGYNFNTLHMKRLNKMLLNTDN